MAELQVGDTVRLKSGGPWMTIKSMDAAELGARCMWFDDNNNVQEAYFPLVVLVVSACKYPFG